MYYGLMRKIPKDIFGTKKYIIKRIHTQGEAWWLHHALGLLFFSQYWSFYQNKRKALSSFITTMTQNYISNLTEKQLNQRKVNDFEWPSQSPDLQDIHTVRYTTHSREHFTSLHLTGSTDQCKHSNLHQSVPTWASWKRCP